ncbi:TorF family putative porin [Thauera phenolivorans]|uniref:TorF family putative porin n=1 Tax=Thauera phenolivorans TaxID=1792543 RepID=UPI00083AEA89|nr:TorF family putative porin [Thauera phenolivorans]
MQKALLTVALLAALPVAGTALAEQRPISANLSLSSDYAFRGVSQTDERPAIQGGFDYAHASGLYAGVWASNVSWLSDAGASNSLETNIYGGYAGETAGIGYDLGVLHYYYPGSYGGEYKAAGGEDPDTTEGYLGLSWEYLSFKYSYAFTDAFGAADSDGSQYFDLGASVELGRGFTLDAHVGYSEMKGGLDNYTDWKLGVTKNLAGLDVGLHYVDTDLDDSDLADERLILSVAKSF